MSYNFKIVKDADGARLVNGYNGEPLKDTDLLNIPDGTFTVSGHHVKDGEAGTESLAVGLVEPGQTYLPVLSASAGTFVDKRVPTDQPST